MIPPEHTSSNTSSRKSRSVRGVRSLPWVWLVYILLFGLSVPWYLPRDEAPPLWLGLPYWVVISIAAIVAIACLVAWSVQRHWPLDDDGSGQ